MIVLTSLLSLSRIIALWKYYHAPFAVVFDFQMHELPRLLNDTGLIHLPPADTKPKDLPQIDLTPIKEFDLRLCLSKEWHRFPGHYLVPDGIRVDFVKSEFDGLLPGHFAEERVRAWWWERQGARVVPGGLNDLNHEEPRHYVRIIRSISSLNHSLISLASL